MRAGEVAVRPVALLTGEGYAEWQRRWDAATVGRWTRRLIPDVKAWAEGAGGGVAEVGYFSTQLLSGHGGFRAYLTRFRIVESSLCLHCGDVCEDAEHVLVTCPRFCTARTEMTTVLGVTTPEEIGARLVRDRQCWQAFSDFAIAVGQTIQAEERAREAENRSQTDATTTSVAIGTAAT